MQNKETVLRVNDLCVSYGFVSALRNVSAEVFERECVALIGANGAGKSTFLQTVIGIVRPKRGDILFMGQEITHRSTDRIVASGISLCPEGRGILPQMTVLENLLLGAYHHRETIQDSLKRVFQIFPKLEERKKQNAGTLSGGEQQMVSLGRGLMSSPRLLMLDEPSLGLAPLVVKEVFRIIGELAQGGYTILLSEQNAKKALECTKRAYVFETGKLVLAGESRELMRKQAVVDAYLGGRGGREAVKRG